MKKSKLLLASLLVSFALVSTQSMANPSKKKIPGSDSEQLTSTESSMDWFFDLLSF